MKADKLIAKVLRQGKPTWLFVNDLAEPGMLKRLRLYPNVPNGRGIGLHVVHAPKVNETLINDGRIVLSRSDAQTTILALAVTLGVDDADLAAISAVLEGVADAKAD